ncbi:uncharacterized protein LOC142351839 [Convolutriloba macropyga]|uniref:uncharacterized protein LOC142351839 n=1 Tax=Convolutriloba macropyga TaxID=536237 RepID=UPI003F51E580
MEIYAEITLYISVCVTLATLGMGLCGICGDNWVDASTFHYGLWRYCFKYQTQTRSATCYDIRDVLEVEGYHTFTQVFFVSGVGLCLIILLMLGLIITMRIHEQDRKLFIFVSLIFSIIQACLLFIGCAVFQAKTDNRASSQGIDQDWTMALAWTAACFSVVNAIIMAIHAVLNRDFYQI